MKVRMDERGGMLARPPVLPSVRRTRVQSPLSLLVARRVLAAVAISPRCIFLISAAAAVRFRVKSSPMDGEGKV